MWKSLKSWLGKNQAKEAGTEAKPSAPDANAPSSETPVEVADLSPFYSELGLETGADLNTVRRAWKKALKQVHLDHYADDPETKRKAHDKAQRLNEAYRILQDHLF